METCCRRAPEMIYFRHGLVTVRRLRVLGRSVRFCTLNGAFLVSVDDGGDGPRYCVTTRSCTSIRATTPPPNCAIGARRTNTSGRYCGSADSRFTLPPSRSIPTPTRARETCLDGWARDRKGIRGGSWREAELREEYDAISRVIEHPNPVTVAPYGGLKKAARRHVELKDLLANPLPYRIRIDTFEIWRSWRIYPDGVRI